MPEGKHKKRTTGKGVEIVKAQLPRKFRKPMRGEWRAWRRKPASKTAKRKGAIERKSFLCAVRKRGGVSRKKGKLACKI